MDIIRNDNGTVTIRGYVQSADPYATNSTLIKVSSKACGLQPACTATAEAAVAPSCSLFPVDMSFCGMEGLVTDRCADWMLSTRPRIPRQEFTSCWLPVHRLLWQACPRDILYLASSSLQLLDSVQGQCSAGDLLLGHSDRPVLPSGAGVYVR